jgi:hypothetical protein
MEKLETMTGTGKEMVSTPAKAHKAPTNIPGKMDNNNRGQRLIRDLRAVYSLSQEPTIIKPREDFENERKFLENFSKLSLQTNLSIKS